MNSVKILHAVRSAITAIAELLVISYRNDVTEKNDVWDVLHGSDFCVQSYLYTKSKS